MGLKIKMLALLVGLGFFFFVFRSVQRNAMRPAYAVLWIMMGLFLVSISVAEPLYQWLAFSVIGIADARHVVYAALIGFLMVYVFYLTQKISKMGDLLQVLLSQVAILEDELQRKIKRS